MALALGPSVERKFNKTFSRQESTSHMNMITHYQMRSIQIMKVNILIHSMYRPSQHLSVLH